MRGWSGRGAAVQWLTLAVLIVALTTLTRLHPEWFGPGESGQAPTPLGTGRYVAIDGDSFHLGRSEIRLHGIDAPEYRQTCVAAGGAVKPCGKMARDELSRMIGNASVACTLVERDRYRRNVSECTAGGLNLNREMVRRGWAMAYRKHLQHDPGNIVAAEAEARAAKRGIWAWRFDPPEDYRRRSRAVQGGMAGAAGEDFKDE